MIVKRFQTRGTVLVGKGGVEIPTEVILEKDSRMEGGILRVDHLWISRIRGGERDGDYKVIVSEEGDGKEGGGIFGDLLDSYVKDEQKKRGSFYYCIGYDKQKGGDIYYMTFAELFWVWGRYLKEVKGRQEVSSSASIARSRNMEKARKARALKTKHLKTHFA